VRVKGSEENLSPSDQREHPRGAIAAEARDNEKRSELARVMRRMGNDKILKRPIPQKINQKKVNETKENSLPQTIIIQICEYESLYRFSFASESIFRHIIFA
jgi:hypothetical protein